MLTEHNNVSEIIINEIMYQIDEGPVQTLKWTSENITISIGQILTMMANVSNVSGTVTYIWSPSMDCFEFSTSTTNSFTFRPMCCGSFEYTLTVVDNDNKSGNKNTATFGLNVSPIFIGNTFTFDINGTISSYPCSTIVHVCAYDKVIVTANPHTFLWTLPHSFTPETYTFLWTLPNGETSNSQTIMVNTLDLGTFTYQVQIGTGATTCGYIIYDIKIIVSADVSITATVDNTILSSYGTICVTTNTMLTLTVSSCITNSLYQWYKDNNAIDGATNNIFIPDTGTTDNSVYIVTISTSTSFIFVTFCSITVNIVNPINAQIETSVNSEPSEIVPHNSTIHVNQGTVVTLMALPVSNDKTTYNYQWRLEGINYSTSQSITIYDNLMGTYNYTVTVSYANLQCSSCSCNITLVISLAANIIPIINDETQQPICNGSLVVHQYDKVRLLAKSTNQNVHYLWSCGMSEAQSDEKIISTKTLIKVNTKKSARLFYTLIVISNSETNGKL